MEFHLKKCGKSRKEWSLQQMLKDVFQHGKFLSQVPGNYLTEDMVCEDLGSVFAQMRWSDLGPFYKKRIQEESLVILKYCWRCK